MYSCGVCEKSFQNIESVAEHAIEHYNDDDERKIMKKCTKSVFDGRIVSYTFENLIKTDLDIMHFFQNTFADLRETLAESVEKHLNIKYNLVLTCKYVKTNADGDAVMIDIFTHRTKVQEVLGATYHLDDLIEDNFKALKEKMESFQERDSGWSLTEIISLELSLQKYQPLKGTAHIPLPLSIKKKEACINVKNSDVYCFKWAIISALSASKYKKNLDRCSTYRIENINESMISVEGRIINFSNLDFPLQIIDVAKFEEINADISINVFGLEGNTVIGPYYLTKEEKSIHLNLLLIFNSRNDSHYVWIKDLSRILCTQLTNHKTKLYFC